MITVVSPDESETVSWSGDVDQAAVDLVTYLRNVASPDYTDRVLSWWHGDREQIFTTNNTRNVAPENDPHADTWTWQAVSMTPPKPAKVTEAAWRRELRLNAWTALPDGGWQSPAGRTWRADSAMAQKLSQRAAAS